jgi:hypothetical protein
LLTGHRPHWLSTDSEIIKTYWRAVELLGTKVPRSPNETHREYLGRVAKALPEVCDHFGRITEAYERVRWGAVTRTPSWMT